MQDNIIKRNTDFALRIFVCLFIKNFNLIKFTDLKYLIKPFI